MHAQLNQADYDDEDGRDAGASGAGGGRKTRYVSSDGLRERRHSSVGSQVDAKNIDMLREEVGSQIGEEDDGKKDNTKMLIISFVLMVFVGLGNKVFQKLMTIPMHNYPNFLNLMTTFVYIPVSFAYIIPMIKRGVIDEEQVNMSKKPFFVMGALDAVAGIMQVFAATYLDGPLLILLSQAAIPMSMVISSYMLKARYSIMQYFGAVVVAGGIACVLAPSVSGDGNVLWSIIMIVSTIPMALSSVYKEIALGDQELDPIFLNGWIAVFQFLFSLVLCIPASLASEPPVPVNELPQNVLDGLLCYGGTDSVECPADQDDGSQCVTDDCTMSPLFVTLYLAFNIGYNILIILIIKFGSASLLFMALTIMVPLGNIAFTLDFVPQHKPLSPYDIIGLVIICSGLFFYRFANTIIKKRCGGTLCGVDVVSAGEDEETDMTKPLLEQDIERVGAQLDRDSRILNQMLNDDGLSLHSRKDEEDLSD